MTVSKVVLAKLSPTMEEGTIVKWTKKEGDVIKQGDVLAEIETDKANMEMEALGGGVLRKIFVPAGGKAPIGSLIGIIAEPDEDISKLMAQGAANAATPAPAASVPAPEPAAAAVDASQKAAPADQPASAASAARTPPAPKPTLAPEVSSSDGGGSSAEGGRVKASPLARSMAAHKNIDLASVAGSGPNGRIIKRDIESWSAPRVGSSAARASSRPSSGSARPAPAGPQVTPGQELPLSNMRKTIARRLVESMFSAPHYYVTVEIDMDA
ncbi:MAG TPA: biotin/lipoyl-containing protein, partial [Vicinamibacteria bacterium]|nr:biotin/lipoyl-containing protein [Vicinamibacteria bacterium]